MTRTNVIVVTDVDVDGAKLVEMINATIADYAGSVDVGYLEGQPEIKVPGQPYVPATGGRVHVTSVELHAVQG